VERQFVSIESIFRIGQTRQQQPELVEQLAKTESDSTLGGLHHR
jgi:hypothetical protein